MSDLLGACVDQCRDSLTTEGQANPKESRERRGALGVGPGDRTSIGVPKDDAEVRSLTESVRESDRKIV